MALDIQDTKTLRGLSDFKGKLNDITQNDVNTMNYTENPLENDS